MDSDVINNVNVNAIMGSFVMGNNFQSRKNANGDSMGKVSLNQGTIGQAESNPNVLRQLFLMA